MNMNSYNCCFNSTPEGQQINHLAETLKVITEPSHLKLICILRKKEACVCEIAQIIGFSPSLTSHHLKDLRQIKLVNSDKRGKKVYYSLSEKGLFVAKLLFKLIEKGC